MIQGTSRRFGGSNGRGASSTEKAGKYFASASNIAGYTRCSPWVGTIEGVGAGTGYILWGRGLSLPQLASRRVSFQILEIRPVAATKRRRRTESWSWVFGVSILGHYLLYCYSALSRTGVFRKARAGVWVILCLPVMYACTSCRWFLTLSRPLWWWILINFVDKNFVTTRFA